MYNLVLPTKIDNTFQGHRLALWLFGAVLIVKAVQCVSVLINGFEIVRAADGIPLETYSPPSAHTIVTAFAAMGISRLAFILICAVALVRYRSALVFLFALLVIHDVARELVLHPVREGTPVGVFVNLGLLVLTVAGLVLSARRFGPTSSK